MYTLRASALYLVIIIALVIGLLCSSLIVAAYFYKIQYQKKFRYDQLENNLASGINILTTAGDSAYASGKTFSLFNTDADSVSLKTISWGVYDIGVAEAFIQKDTLFKTFSLASAIDSAKWAALYLVDEDRPFSLSGKTTIRGDAYIPKAGVQKAYIDNKAYTGDARLIIGTKHLSEKTLPALDASRLTQLAHYFQPEPGSNNPFKTDSMQQSFLQPTYVINLKKEAQTLQNMHIGGNIIMVSDTTLVIDSTAQLKNILVFARAIVVKEGFHGSCQLFASDSISVGRNCRFTYPSCLGLLRSATSIVKSQAKITLGENTVFNGILFSYEKTDGPLKPLITLGKSVTVTGQIYSQGILELKDQTTVDGSVFTSRFLYKSSFTIYENYLINATLDAKAISSYYLTSDLLPVAKKKKRILQWLEAN